MDVRRVGVIGCGLMGSGIAQVCAASGYQTVVIEVDEKVLEAGMGRLRESVAAAVKRGKMEGQAAQELHARLSTATSLEALEGCDLVIEAVTENAAVKKEIFAKADRIVGEAATLASNTSSICIMELAAAVRSPERVVGLHFFNPVPRMKLVELIRTLVVSEETLARSRAFAESLGKTVVEAADSTGFIVNRLLVPYLLEAIRMVEAGVAKPEEIDTAMMLGCGYPMGPMKLLDFVGLDTTEAIAEVFYEEYKERLFAPPSLLRRMVRAGRLGMKSGRGFYEYGSD